MKKSVIYILSLVMFLASTVAYADVKDRALAIPNAVANTVNKIVQGTNKNVTAVVAGANESASSLVNDANELGKAVYETVGGDVTEPTNGDVPASA